MSFQSSDFGSMKFVSARLMTIYGMSKVQIQITPGKDIVTRFNVVACISDLIKTITLKSEGPGLEL